MQWFEYDFNMGKKLNKIYTAVLSMGLMILMFKFINTYCFGGQLFSYYGRLFHTLFGFSLILIPVSYIYLIRMSFLYIMHDSERFLEKFKGTTWLVIISFIYAVVGIPLIIIGL